MNSIVLVKQVPDLSDLRPDAWDEEKGTLRRSVLDSVLNPLDLHALSLAYFARKQSPQEKNGKIIVLTMGPPQAEEALRDCIARCADEAVLLTDRSFAGADTCATAFALAHAIQKIVEEFQLGDEYLIFSGMQSIDGDTAQVPPQVAEHLGIEQIAYAEKIEYKEGGWMVSRIGPHGREIVRPKRLPVLITAASSEGPIYRSFHRARMAFYHPIRRLSAQDLQVPLDRIGLKGSRTHVIRIFSPTETQTAPCEIVHTPQELAKKIEELWKTGSRRKGQKKEKETKYELGDRKPDWRGEIWVFAEQEEGQIHSVALELLGTARRLAEPLGEKVAAILLGHNVREKAELLIAHGADRVYVADDPRLKDFYPIPYKKVLAAAIQKYRPQIVLYGATPLGRELAPRVAYATGSGLTADCTQLEIGDIQRGSLSAVGILKQTRPALGGNIMATIITRNSLAQMATVRPGVMKALPANPNRRGEIIELSVDVEAEDFWTEVLERQPLAKGARLTEAEIIVAGGHGMGSKEAFEQYLRPLAQVLEERFQTTTEIGASRAAVEEGFIGRDHQVGQTGQTVRPRLYIAVGISGAIQHLAGIQQAEIIVAINKDPHAPIFRHADAGIVAEYEQVIPSLIEALKQPSLVTAAT